MKPIAWIGFLLILVGIGSHFYNPFAGMEIANSWDFPLVLIMCGISLMVFLSSDRHRFR